jgi:hypothetical protein
MTLFSDNFRQVDNDDEFAELQKSYPKYDAGYLCQGAYKSRAKTKDWMESMWQQYEQYADPGFLLKFKSNFTERSWELYLGSTFLNRGFKLGTNSGEGPDFDVCDKDGVRKTWVEAIAVGPGKGEDRVPEPNYERVVDRPIDAMCLRITNALTTKYNDKYLRDLRNGRIAANAPYVIAIDKSELVHLDGNVPLILKVLFGIGDLRLTFPVPQRGDMHRRDKPERSWSRKSKVQKVNGTSIPTIYFETSEYEGISAVIYSTRHVINSPRVPTEMGEHFIIVHNPFAKNPLPPGVFPFGEEYFANDDLIVRTSERENHSRYPMFLNKL